MKCKLCLDYGYFFVTNKCQGVKNYFSMTCLCSCDKAAKLNIRVNFQSYREAEARNYKNIQKIQKEGVNIRCHPNH